MEVLIVGSGAMGRWFGGAIDADVAFADEFPAAADEAAAEVDERRPGRARSVPLDALATFDAVCIAVPMTAATDAIARHVGRASEAVLDVTGAMAGPVEAMRRHAPSRERASLHPLFAPENAPGRIAVVDDAPGPVTGTVLDDLTDGGNTLVETTPEEHDHAMRTVQARTHAAVLAFGLAAEAVPDGFGTPIFDGLSDLLSEVTAGTPRVYADIQEVFAGAEDVADAARRIADADRETFEALYRDAGG